MEPILIQTARLRITEWEPSMAAALSRISQDRENRRFLPDEVFETPEQALEAIQRLLRCRETGKGAQVLPVLLPEGTLIGHVEIAPLEDARWEAGYHIGALWRGQGYAAEALEAFLPVILPELGLTHCWGICAEENRASRRVLERCGFQPAEEKETRAHGRPAVMLRYSYTLPKAETQKES